MTPQIKQRIEQIRRGEVPEGYKKTKVGIVPEEWEEGFLGNYIQEYKELSNDIEKYPVYSSSRQGLIPQSQYYDNREAVETNLGYKIVPNGYVTYRHMSDDDVFHFNVNNTGGEILVSSEYPVFSSTEKSSLGYIIPMLNDTARFRYFCRTQKMGGTRTRLYYKNLCNYKSVFPPFAEQEKISAILQTQDKVIELQQKKIGELKKLKKVYLSKMFPQKGCNVPEIRFPGFTAPWEQRKVFELAEKTYGGGTPATSNEAFWNGNIPWIQSSDIVDGKLFGVVPRKHITQEGLNNSATQLVPENSIAIITRVGVGKLAFMPFPYTTSQDFLSLSKLNTEPFFTVYACYKKLQSELNTVQGTSIKGITKDELLAKIIMVPEYAEQQQIGAFFRNLDNLITLHQRKCDEEKQKKKALMQLLLTGIVRVKYDT